MIITGVSGEHRRQDRVLEPVRKMFGLDEEVEGALGYRGICLMVCFQTPAAMNPKAELLPWSWQSGSIIGRAAP